MKALSIKIGLITTYTLVLMACDKNDTTFQQTQTKSVQTEVKEYTPSRTVNYTGKYFEAIDTICPAYLQFTTKIDISNLQNDQYYSSISDGNLTIVQPRVDGYGVPFLKKNPTTTEWWKEWNISPYVETKNPHNLNMGDYWGGTTLILSKKCYVFGIEVGSLLNEYYTQPMIFVVSFSDRNLIPGPTGLGYIMRTITGPNGALLFAIKSNKPFDEVHINFIGGPADKVRAYSIANIRYLTDKEIYNKHKND